jgi:hypothetical protein
MSMADVKAVEHCLEHFGVPIVGGDTKSIGDLASSP